MKLVPNLKVVSESTELVTVNDAWQRIPESKKLIANDRGQIVAEVKQIIVSEGYSQRAAIELLLLRVSVDEGADDRLIELMKTLGKKGKLPSYSTINRWVNDFNTFGLIGLAPKHKGSEQQSYGWEARAMRLYSLPSKPAVNAVARKLMSEDFKNVTYDRVYRFIMSLPSHMGDKSRGRMGTRLYTNTQKSFVRRSTENLPVGACLQGDGHTLDLYLKHPTGKKPWRAELTLWLDVASRYVVGWFVSDAESAHSTLFALSHAVLTHNHIPTMLHIDNGSGYKNKMMSNESTGFYSRLGIDIMHSLPYNAKGKGHVERFFGTMERDFNKWYPSYCGADMADEAIQLLLKKHKKGELELPTQEQWMFDFNEWLVQYHNKPHDGLNGKTPAELWSKLEAFPLENNMQSLALFRPQKIRTVRRESIQLDSREYMSPELVQYNNKKLTAEYDLHNDAFIRVLDDKGRWICDAKLVKKADYVPASRLKEAEQKKLASSIKRLEVHIQEKHDRAGSAITHDQIIDDVEAMSLEDDSTLLEKTTGTEVPVDINLGDQTEDDEIDFTDLSYLKKDK